MKKKYNYFTGIDVSKLTLDVCIMHRNVNMSVHKTFANNQPGIAKMFKWLSENIHTEITEGLFCLEHTGIYAMPLCYSLKEYNCDFALVPAIEIKRSIGLCRGKSDKQDAISIARYAMLRSDSISLYQIPEKKLVKLKTLITHRNLLVKQKKQLQVVSKEYKGFIDTNIIKDVCKQNISLIKNIEKHIKKTETLMAELINSDHELKWNDNLLQSIPGIGPQISANLIVATRCFTLFETSRQFACYCGVAPFPYRSGTSIKGRSKVSPYANKALKALLNLAALNAKRKDKQLYEYALKKEKEGKNKMLINNNLRNKIIGRVFATIKRGTPYVITMKYAA